MNGDEVRNVKFGKGEYDASQVNDLLERIAAELDAGRPAGPLIANATFREREWRFFRRGCNTGAVDWFLEQLQRREDPSVMARMNADPWRDLAADPYCVRREPGGPAGRVAAPSRQEYADAWRDFGQQPGTRLSLVSAGGAILRCELRTPEQHTVATSNRWLARTFRVGGRTFTRRRVAQSSWPGIAETISPDRPDVPTHTLKPQTGQKDFFLKQVLDETGTPVLYTGGRHFSRFAGAYIKFPGDRWLRFPVRGAEDNAIMTAVDQAGNKVARYRLARTEASRWRSVEITVHPSQQLTDELTLVIALSAHFLRSYFREGGGG